MAYFYGFTPSLTVTTCAVYQDASYHALVENAHDRMVDDPNLWTDSPRGKSIQGMAWLRGIIEMYSKLHKKEQNYQVYTECSVE